MGGGGVSVEARARTLRNIGERIEPLKAGAITQADIVADFWDDPALFARRSEEEITIAKNGGGAHLDLMTAVYIQRAWRAR